MGALLLIVDTLVDLCDNLLDLIWYCFSLNWSTSSYFKVLSVSDGLSQLKELWTNVIASHPLTVPIATVIFLFWPVFVSLIMAFGAASTWLFWLVTSAVFGVVQLVYVLYQFVAILTDLFLLSLLKTYSLMRSQILYYVGIKGRTGSSRRRVWRKKVYSCDEKYSAFLDIGVEAKPRSAVKATNNNKSADRRRQKNKRRRTNSFTKSLSNAFSSTNKTNDEDNLFLDSSSSSSIPPSNGGMRRHRSENTLISRSDSFGAEAQIPRNRSFGHRTNASLDDDENDVSAIDPIVLDELGMTGEMLVTTTARLREARLQATDPAAATISSRDNTGELENITDPHQNTASASSSDPLSSIKYLLSGVVKRNHLSVDDILIENCRSVAESGQYGLTRESRQVISDYQEEVETCLDWIADSPVTSDASSSLNQGSGSNHGSESPYNTYFGSNGSTTAANVETGGCRTASANRAGYNHSSSTNSLELGTTGSASALNPQLKHRNELIDRMTLVRKMKQNMGRTALMLSGGGAQAMYHLGTVRALVDSKQYQNIRVISGTSGGSITAAMCALKTPEELFADVCVPTVSTDYGLDGRMKRETIRWFPPAMEMGLYWLKTSLLVDSKDFKKCCDFYYGDVTFEEAFERTGKHVCITVSASRAGSGSSGGAQRLLLNHISTPHVTLSSAVSASCALPGVMAPAKLLTKDSNGRQEPFEVDGLEWIDGSVQADLPFQRISTLFNVSNYIVCQTNFHIMPFLNKEHHPSRQSTYWRLFQTIEWDIRSRALKLSRLGLFPRIFGQDISKVFKQKYHGNLTLIPRFTAMQTFGLKSLSNPTVKDMEGYLKYGQIAAWPYIEVIRDMIHLETVLDNALSRLEARLRFLSPSGGDWSNHDDDVESIASSSIMLSGGMSARVVRFGAAYAANAAANAAEAEKLKAKVSCLESENDLLRQQLQELRRKLQGTDPKGSIQATLIAETPRAASYSRKRHTSSGSDDDGKGIDDTSSPSKENVLSERDVWNVVRGRPRVTGDAS